MAKKDIFKTDNYFIKFGIILMVIGLFTTFTDPRTYSDLMLTEDGQHYSFEDYKGRTLQEIQREVGKKVEITILEMPVIRPLIAFSGLLLLLFGIAIRKKENKIIAIWDALERTTESKVIDLEVSLGIKRDFIFENLKHINAQLGAYYVYISAKDIIVDGKLLEEHVVSIKCSGCGTNVNKKISLSHLEDLNCTYCGAGIPVGDLADIRGDILKENDIERLTKAAMANNKMSMPIFIALLLVFWPGAIVYYIVKQSSSSKKIEDSMSALHKYTQENFAK